MEVFDNIGLDIGYVLLGSIGVIVILFILNVISLCKVRSLKKRYKSFMSGNSVENMEERILEKFNEIDGIKEDNIDLQKQLNSIKKTMKLVYQKVGIVKYDAFSEMGGKLSFVLVLLTEENDGFLLNSMHSSREGCYTYIKEIVKGESFVVLSNEEKDALKQAIECKTVSVK